MKNNRILNRTLIHKNFSKMQDFLRSKLLSLLFTAAEENDYLESLSSHADTIGWHLHQIEIFEFLDDLDIFFDMSMKQISKDFHLNNLTIAFDETFVPYYGKNKNSPWIHGYTNNVKGAKGSYKFMVASIIMHDKRFVLSMLPMATGDNNINKVDIMLKKIKKHFRISLVLLDRGFANKELAYLMKKENQKYIALCPKWANVKRFMKNKENAVSEQSRIYKHRKTIDVKMNYKFVYNKFKFDWAFLADTKLSGVDLIRAYKARWGIETTFRVMDQADIKSKSTNIVIRTFFFLISIILYNLWIADRMSKNCTFSQYLDNIALAAKDKEELIRHWENARKKVGDVFNIDSENDIFSIMLENKISGLCC